MKRKYTKEQVERSEMLIRDLHSQRRKAIAAAKKLLPATLGKLMFAMMPTHERHAIEWATGEFEVTGYHIGHEVYDI